MLNTWNTIEPNVIGRPDVTHSLHCLNAIRVEMSKILYPNSTHQSHDHNLGNAKVPPGWDIAHTEVRLLGRISLRHMFVLTNKFCSITWIALDRH